VPLDIKSKTFVDTDELLLSAAAAAIPCVLFDQILYAIQKWQRTRAGVIAEPGFGPFGRTLISLFVNFGLCGVIAYLYRSIGHEVQDAFLIGATLWLIVAVPVLFTSRYVDETQKPVLASRILGWLVKTLFASTSAAYFITFGS